MSKSIRSCFLPLFVLPLLSIAACGDEDSPTAPSASSTQLDAATTAGQLVVNSLADPGNGTCDIAECTLREAIEDPASTEIGFAPGLSGPVTLATPEKGGGVLVIDKALAITGPPAGMVVRRRVADPPFRILRVGKAGVVKLTNLTLRGGRTDLPGGGIINFGTLTLENCKVKANTSTAHGGGIDNHGPLTLTNTRVTENGSGGSTPTGGIDNHNNSRLTISNSVVSYNVGLGLANDGSTLRITNSVISHNSGATGGGISQYRGTATLDRVKVLDNSEGGGIRLSNGEMTIINSTIARNVGDGVRGRNGSSYTIVGSTIANNSGIGVYSEAFMRNGVSLRLLNSTVSGNAGGGVKTYDDVEASAYTDVVNSTVAFNGGVGLHVGGDNAVLTFTNTVVARNGDGTTPDVTNSKALLGASYSLVGNGTGSGLTNTDGNLVGNVSPYSGPIDPLLGSLTNNGGPTATHALLAGSPALDAGTSEGCPTTDQRGVARPQGPACDMGSFER